MDRLLLGLALIGAVMGCAGGDDDDEPDTDGDGRPGCTDRFLCVSADAGMEQPLTPQQQEAEARRIARSGVRWTCTCTDPLRGQFDQFRDSETTYCTPSYGLALTMARTDGLPDYTNCSCCHDGLACDVGVTMRDTTCERDPDNDALCADPRAMVCGADAGR